MAKGGIDLSAVEVHVVALTGPASSLRQVQWAEERYPSTAHQQVPRGLLSFYEEEGGTARGVWYSTLPGYLHCPEGVEVADPTEEEVEAAKRKIAVHYVRRAINDGNYVRVAKVFLARHRQARKEPTEFDAICAAAMAEAEVR